MAAGKGLFEAVIKQIRSIDPDNIILVGAPLGPGYPPACS